jgi:hypothetical protein
MMSEAITLLAVKPRIVVSLIGNPVTASTAGAMNTSVSEVTATPPGRDVKSRDALRRASRRATHRSCHFHAAVAEVLVL